MLSMHTLPVLGVLATSTALPTKDDPQTSLNSWQETNGVSSLVESVIIRIDLEQPVQPLYVLKYSEFGPSSQ